MNVGPDLSKIAAVIADPSRGKMLASLMNLDGLPASELAIIAGVTPQTASSHLAKMLGARLIKLSRHGRHRYYSIASEEVANTLEKLALLAPAPQVRHSKDVIELASIKLARTCYGHLAGKVGVALYESLLSQNFVIPDGEELNLTSAGEDFFNGLGIEIKGLKQLRRRFACPCLDWTERKHHLAGALGKALADYMFKEKWLRRHTRSRAVGVMALGEEALQKRFHIDLSRLKSESPVRLAPRTNSPSP